jgi:hypothetical protein
MAAIGAAFASAEEEAAAADVATFAMDGAAIMFFESAQI